MNFLLDTHTFIWSVISVEKLSKKVIQNIEDPGNRIFISTISFWEISIKYSIGKIELQGVMPEDFPILAEKIGFSILALSPAEVSTSYQLKWMPGHKDPFDRILIWQAIRSNYAIISKDENFQRYKATGLNTFW